MYDYDQNQQPTQPERRAPELQENYQAEPWFVSGSEPATNFNGKTKSVLKRTVSVLFPILGLTGILAMLGIVVFNVTRMYQ